jgi:hypothetical protein
VRDGQKLVDDAIDFYRQFVVAQGQSRTAALFRS